MKAAVVASGPGPSGESYERLPGHWVLARLGKRVLRPGGMELTRWMIRELAITGADSVVELAPGIGATAQEILSHNPERYTAVDSSEDVIADLRQRLAGPGRTFVHAHAETTGLPDGSATVVVGEAFLTMQSGATKKRIITEMGRLLRPRGLLGLHELCVVSAEPERAERIRYELSKVIRVNASPLTVPGWKELLSAGGFTIVLERIRPMELLRFRRLVEDEGVLGTARIAINTFKNPRAAKRVVEMRSVFEKYARDLAAISLIARGSG